MKETACGQQEGSLKRRGGLLRGAKKYAGKDLWIGATLNSMTKSNAWLHKNVI